MLLTLGLVLVVYTSPLLGHAHETSETQTTADSLVKMERLF